MLVAFAAVATLLPAVGIYGLLADSVRSRTRELAVRMTFGARPREVLRTVLQRGLGLAATGIAVGLVAALFLARFVESLLYGVDGVDSTTYAAIVALFVGIAFLACLVPAWRALRLDVVEAMRAD